MPHLNGGAVVHLLEHGLVEDHAEELAVLADRIKISFEAAHGLHLLSVGLGELVPLINGAVMGLEIGLHEVAGLVSGGDVAAAGVVLDGPLVRGAYGLLLHEIGALLVVGVLELLWAGLVQVEGEGGLSSVVVVDALVGVDDVLVAGVLCWAARHDVGIILGPAKFGWGNFIDS